LEVVLFQKDFVEVLKIFPLEKEGDLGVAKPRINCLAVNTFEEPFKDEEAKLVINAACL
jgi:hypothetical protein